MPEDPMLCPSCLRSASMLRSHISEINPGETQEAILGARDRIQA